MFSCPPNFPFLSSPLYAGIRPAGRSLGEVRMPAQGGHDSVGKLFRSRHCERSEAIQLTMDGLPRRLLLLAMMSILFIPNAAFACNSEWDFLIERMSQSDIIFEGHPLRYEKKDVSAPDDNKPDYRLVLVYKVDKAWKGVGGSEEIKAYAPLGRLSVDDKLPVLRNPRHEIITLATGKDSLPYGFLCPDAYPVTWQNKLLLSFRYPWAIFQ